jgi:hypothetical protein
LKEGERSASHTTIPIFNPIIMTAEKQK